MRADLERRMVRSELLEVITVFMAVVSLRFGLFWFSGGGFVVCAGSCAKAESPPKTRHNCAGFFIASGRAVKIPRFRAVVLDQVERMDRWLVDRAVDFQTVVSLIRAQRLNGRLTMGMRAAFTDC
jgi:hypothetical protein